MFLLIFPFSTGTFLFDQTYPTRERKRKRFRNTNFPPTIGPFFSLSPFSHALAPTHPFLEMGSHGGGHIFVVQRLSPSGIEARGHGETERGEERKCRVFPPCAGSLSPCISSFFFQFFFSLFHGTKRKGSCGWNLCPFSSLPSSFPPPDMCLLCFLLLCL